MKILHIFKIVIGDEILKGHVQDINSNYLCKELWSLGIRVVKVSIYECITLHYTYTRYQL